LLTEDDDRSALYRSLRTHGEGTTRYDVLRTGMNGRLDSMQAAVLLAKLSVFQDELAARERVARYYDARLGNAVTTPARVRDAASAWAIYTFMLRDGNERDRVQAALRAAGVPTAIYYPRPLHLQPAYREHHDGSQLPVAEDVAHRVLALPIHPYLTDEALEQVAGSVIGAVG
jgi:dTDP-4-amino-4,6-dideoxygalactose transaminase